MHRMLYSIAPDVGCGDLKGSVREYYNAKRVESRVPDIETKSMPVNLTAFFY